MIEAHGLHVGYGRGDAVLRDIDLAAGPGEILALLGPNGSGKSTLLRALAGDLASTAGTVQRVSPIGYAADEAVHIDALTVEQNANWFARANGGTAATAAVPGLLRDFGLAPWEARPAGELSFGGRRKLAIVQALAHRPRLLFLDEPTVGLDPDAVAALLARVRAIAADGGTAIVAGNDLRSAGEIASRVIFLRAGRIVADAPPADLLKDIRGSVRFEVRLAAHAPDVVFDDGVQSTLAAAGYVLRAGSTAVLPGICRSFERAGARITEIRVHEADLSDAWRAITGADWLVGDDAQGAAGTGGAPSAALSHGAGEAPDDQGPADG